MVQSPINWLNEFDFFFHSIDQHTHTSYHQFNSFILFFPLLTNIVLIFCVNICYSSLSFSLSLFTTKMFTLLWCFISQFFFCLFVSCKRLRQIFLLLHLHSNDSFCLTETFHYINNTHSHTLCLCELRAILVFLFVYYES